MAKRKLRIMAIGAHPDDCDVKVGATAILFAKAAHAVKFVSATMRWVAGRLPGGAFGRPWPRRRSRE